ncbi:hypothetical protein WJX74_005755 [Apatococcus lobatus]|uniref:Borealin N-terminal domain-containing protein n=1 Tax=Apatococcus lobatus TaxID=904363 RepID=A0AAW1R3G5_9CHLO
MSPEEDSPEEQFEHLLAYLDGEVETRCQRYLCLAEDAGKSMEMELKVQLVKLPKKVRSMPLAEFREEYGSSIEKVLLANISERLQVLQQQAMPPPSTGLRSSSRLKGPATATRTTRKRAGATSAAESGSAADPAHDPAQQQPLARVQATPAVVQSHHAAAAAGAPPTVLRGPQLGEVFYSKNGSPLGLFEQDGQSQRGMLMTPMVAGGGLPSTVMHPAALAAGGQATATMIKRQGPGGRTVAGNALLICTKDGRQVEVEVGDGLQQVPTDLRKEVRQQLEALSKISAGALKPPKGR